VTNELWSWILTGAGALTAWLSLSGFSRAWLVGLGTQTLWLCYALATHQSGFYCSVAIFSGIYLYNRLRKTAAWRRYTAAVRGIVAKLRRRLPDAVLDTQSAVPEHASARAGYWPGAGTHFIVLDVIPQAPQWTRHYGPGATQRVGYHRYATPEICYFATVTGGASLGFGSTHLTTTPYTHRPARAAAGTVNHAGPPHTEAGHPIATHDTRAATA